jgi:hypothetical protein
LFWVSLFFFETGAAAISLDWMKGVVGQSKLICALLSYEALEASQNGFQVSTSESRWL